METAHQLITPTHVADGVFVVDGAVGRDRCESLRAYAESIGFDTAPIQMGMGRTANVPEVRNNTRAMVDDHALAAELWRALEPWVPARRGPWRAIGLNERIRFYRYRPGQYFRWHRDGSFARNDREHSMLSVLLYLSSDFEGGATDFDIDTELVGVRPARGSFLVFQHDIRHQGAPVERGTKYIARSDVMYRREV